MPELIAMVIEGVADVGVNRTWGFSCFDLMFHHIVFIYRTVAKKVRKSKTELEFRSLDALLRDRFMCWTTDAMSLKSVPRFKFPDAHVQNKIKITI